MHFFNIKPISFMLHNHKNRFEISLLSTFFDTICSPLLFSLYRYSLISFFFFTTYCFIEGHLLISVIREHVTSLTRPQA